MAVTPLDENTRVRNLTTSNTDLLSDDLIDQYLLDYLHMPLQARILFAAADCIDYVLRDARYDMLVQGNKQLQNNLLPARAKDYRRRASQLIMFLV